MGVSFRNTHNSREILCKPVRPEQLPGKINASVSRDDVPAAPMDESANVPRAGERRLPFGGDLETGFIESEAEQARVQFEAAGKRRQAMVDGLTGERVDLVQCNWQSQVVQGSANGVCYGGVGVE